MSDEAKSTARVYTFGVRVLLFLAVNFFLIHVLFPGLALRMYGTPVTEISTEQLAFWILALVVGGVGWWRRAKDTEH